MIIHLFAIPFYAFFFMLFLAGLIGTDNIKVYGIGDKVNLKEEYAIIVGIFYAIWIVRRLFPKKPIESHDSPNN